MTSTVYCCSHCSKGATCHACFYAEMLHLIEPQRILKKTHVPAGSSYFAEGPPEVLRGGSERVSSNWAVCSTVLLSLYTLARAGHGLLPLPCTDQHTSTPVSSRARKVGISCRNNTHTCMYVCMCVADGYFQMDSSILCLYTSSWSGIVRVDTLASAPPGRSHFLRNRNTTMCACM